MLSSSVVKPTCIVASAFLLFACESSSGPSMVEQVRALPVSSLDSGLSEFKAVCLEGKTDIEGDPFIFTFGETSQGQTICTMRARAPENVDVFQTLRQRYGPAREASLTSLATLFTNYPGGDLFLQSGIRGGAGQGTYQLGTVR